MRLYNGGVYILNKTLLIKFSIRSWDIKSTLPSLVAGQRFRIEFEFDLQHSDVMSKDNFSL